MIITDEVELKLEVEPGCLTALTALPELEGATPHARRQVSTYFDTTDHDLRKAGLSLRVRRVGDRRVQTIKAESIAAAGLFARPEWEQDIMGDRPELAGATDAITRLLARPSARGLETMFVADVERTRWDIPVDGATIEFVLDEGEVKAGERAAPISEIELELKHGAQPALFAFARALAERVPVRIGVLTKSERGYRLLDGDAARAIKAELVPLADGMSAAEAFQRIARGCMRHYRLNETLLLRTRGSSPLHQARVALRRLRSAISLFKPMLADERLEHLRAELRTLAAQLGEARNLDVLVERLGDSPVAGDLRGAREKAYDAVETALSAERARNLMLELAEWLAVGTWRTAEGTAALRQRSAERAARDLLERYRRRLKRAGKHIATIDDEARHEARILAKKLRYAAEFFGELYTSKPALRRRKAFLLALERLQSGLGDLNDQATGHAELQRLGISPSAFGLLDRRIDRATLLGQAADAHAALVDTKRFWR